MGMTLGLNRLVEKTPCPKFEGVDYAFDEAKWVDDKRFVNEYPGELEYIQCQVPYCCGSSYWRPRDIENAITWIKENLGIEGRPLVLINTLNEMKSRKDWYFDYS